MSRPKKRVMCPFAQREKMVFETKEEAVRFINWNANAFANPTYRPRRCYWCSGCGGWHITHTNKILKPRKPEDLYADTTE